MYIIHQYARIERIQKILTYSYGYTQIVTHFLLIILRTQLGSFFLSAGPVGSTFASTRDPIN